jgi:hypothetical protein
MLAPSPLRHGFGHAGGAILPALLLAGLAPASFEAPAARSVMILGAGTFDLSGGTHQ